MSTNEKFLPYGNNNDLIIANSQGDVIRSGYSIITEEKYITEKDKSKKFIPNAQTVAKFVNTAVKAQEKNETEDKKFNLSYGNNNDLIIANSNGEILRSGYSVVTEEKYITPKNKSKKFIPNAQTVAKTINAAIESVQEKVALVNEFITQITPAGSCADIVIAKENGFDGVELTAQNLEEVLKVCRGLGIKPYINIQTENEFASIINLVKKYNLLANTTFVSTDYNILNAIKNQYPTNGLLYKIAGFVAGDRIYDVIVNNLLNLQTSKNKVTVAVNAPDCQVNSYFINDFVEICINNDIDLCSWAKTEKSDTEEYILNAHPYVSTFINSKFVPEKVLHAYYSSLYKK